jgi:hypothetical protein
MITNKHGLDLLAEVCKLVEETDMNHLYTLLLDSHTKTLSTLPTLSTETPTRRHRKPVTRFQDEYFNIYR